MPSLNIVKILADSTNKTKSAALLTSVRCSGVGSRDEERLVRDLFRGYNKLIRPVQNMTQKVQVAFGLAFIQLINVVSNNRHFHLNC